MADLQVHRFSARELPIELLSIAVGCTVSLFSLGTFSHLPRLLEDVDVVDVDPNECHEYYRGRSVSNYKVISSSELDMEVVAGKMIMSGPSSAKESPFLTFMRAILTCYTCFQEKFC